MDYNLNLNNLYKNDMYYYPPKASVSAFFSFKFAQLITRLATMQWDQSSLLFILQPCEYAFDFPLTIPAFVPEKNTQKTSKGLYKPSYCILDLALTWLF